MHRPFNYHAIEISSSYSNCFKESYIWESKKIFRKNPNEQRRKKNYKGDIEIWLEYFIIRHNYGCLWCTYVSFGPRPRLLTPVRRFARDITPWSNLRKNISRECSRKCFRDVVNLLFWKLLLNVCKRGLWVELASYDHYRALLRGKVKFFYVCSDNVLMYRRNFLLAAINLAVPVSIFRQPASLWVSKFVITFNSFDTKLEEKFAR